MILVLAPRPSAATCWVTSPRISRRDKKRPRFDIDDKRRLLACLPSFLQLFVRAVVFVVVIERQDLGNIVDDRAHNVRARIDE